MANKNLQGTIEYYIKGQYGLIKGEDGKEYCFGRKAVTARAKLFNGDVVRFTVDQKHHILALKVTSYVAVRSKIRKRSIFAYSPILHSYSIPILFPSIYQTIFKIRNALKILHFSPVIIS